MSRRVETKKVSQRELREIAKEKGSVYGGSTVNPDARAYQHERNGMRGTMYYASTTNMMKSEDALLEVGNFRHNMHQMSGAKQDNGNIYVCQGQKRNN